MDYFIRRLRAEDIIQVVEIEREAFSPLWISTPFKRELNNRFACHLVVCPPEAEAEAEAAKQPEAAPQAESDSLWSRVSRRARGLMRPSRNESPVDHSVAGYVSVWYQGEEAHITEIAVREDLRGHGLGELLLIGSLREALEYGSEVMTLEARVSNFIAQRLYEKYGFKQVGIRKGYYSDNREDAVIMTTTPIHSEEYTKSFSQLQDAYQARWREIRIEA